MAACELCWDAAFMISRMFGTDQAEEYRVLLGENDDVHGHPTAPSTSQQGDGQ